MFGFHLYLTNWNTCLERTQISKQCRYKLLGPGGPGLVYVAYVFVFLGSIIFCRLYKLTLSDQAWVNLQLTASLSDME